MSLLTAARDPRWIGCIDFGTALSKAAMVKAGPRSELTEADILALAVGARDDVGVRNPLLLPSVAFIDETSIRFGQEAEDAAIRAERRQRQAFRSPKQYLSLGDSASSTSRFRRKSIRQVSMRRASRSRFFSPIF